MTVSEGQSFGEFDGELGSDFLFAHWKDSGARDGVLTLAARCDGFAGRAEALFNVEDVARFAAELQRFPLEREVTPTISGGYLYDSSDSDEPGYVEQVGMVVRPHGELGQLVVVVHLIADSTLSDSRVELANEVRLNLPTSHQQISEFGEQLITAVDQLEGTAELRVHHFQ